MEKTDDVKIFWPGAIIANAIAIPFVTIAVLLVVIYELLERMVYDITQCFIKIIYYKQNREQDLIIRKFKDNG